MLFEKQEYQENCVGNIIEVLKDYDFQINDSSVLNNALKDFYKKMRLPIQDINNQTRLDIEMETGTGKTFTYIKTVFELNKQYKQNKFIIFVPRKAIREGVIQNIELTSDYFFQEYGKRISLYTYDSKLSISKIKNHYLKNQDELSVLVLTNSSIDKKDTNIIHKTQEDLFGDDSIFHSLQNLKPILIIDEPHLLKGDAFSKVFNEFDSLCFRFGATFPVEVKHKLSNMVYSLDSVTSFKQYLVKKIRVNTVVTNESKLKVYDTSANTVELLYFQDDEEKKITVSKNDDIGLKIGMPEYHGISIVNISAKDKKVYLSNQTDLNIENNYELSDEEIRLMIQKTISSHFEKEERFFDRGVKTLSLFFIPSIESYRGENPLIRKIFEEEFKTIRNNVLNQTKNQSYKNYLAKDIDEEGNLTVNEGYFSGDKGSADDKIASGIDLILRDKEKLLSFDTSLRFIFSVWALQEGWDNPNVFNICKLANTDKETSRRQQIGRGLRLCVNQDGKRLTYKYCNENQEEFYRYNTLDVIVSGKEKNFIEEIQNEILANSHTQYLEYKLAHTFFTELGLDRRQASRLELLLDENQIIQVENDHYNIIGNISEFVQTHKDDVLDCKIDEELYNTLIQELHKIERQSKENNTPLVTNGNKKTQTVNIRQDKLEQFKELWETINRKSKIVYKEIQEDTIIEKIATIFNAEEIPAVYTKIETKEYDVHTNRVINKAVENHEKILFLQDRRYKEFMLEFIKDEKLPLNFVIKLFNKLDRQKLANNPREAKSLLRKFIKESLHGGLLQSVEYQLEGTKQITSLHNDNTGEYKTTIDHTLLGRHVADETPRDLYLYDKIVWDSKFEKEIILNDPESINTLNITVFAKLPKISIPTPYKSYNPDFAYLMQTNEGKTLFLVVESKGYHSENDIPKEEMQKIAYAEKFFEKLQQELPHIEIRFKKRINRYDLASLLEDMR